MIVFRIKRNMVNFGTVKRSRRLEVGCYLLVKSIEYPRKNCGSLLSL